MLKRKPENMPRRREVILHFDCPCGTKHEVLLGVGELEILARACFKGKGLEDFKIRHRHILSPAQISGLVQNFKRREIEAEQRERARLLAQ